VQKHDVGLRNVLQEAPKLHAHAERALVPYIGGFERLGSLPCLSELGQVLVGAEERRRAVGTRPKHDRNPTETQILWGGDAQKDRKKNKDTASITLPHNKNFHVGFTGRAITHNGLQSSLLGHLTQ
jgi:hypothetical protein